MLIDLSFLLGDSIKMINDRLFKEVEERLIMMALILGIILHIE